jgi:hypothetical protein
MKLRSIPLFLAGDRAAILDLAASRWTLPIGFLFVLSASLARNYDGADLLHEYKVLTHGLAASIVNSLILFMVVHTCAEARREPHHPPLPHFGRAYLVFLGLFWMTAPMGWLYGIPFERMYEAPVDAIRANLWLLALVSIWRVVLITRVLAVLWGTGFGSLIFLVLVFADIAVFAAAHMMPTPLIDFMGGLQHSEEDALVGGLTFALMFWSVLLAPGLAIAALIGLKWFTPAWFVPRPGTTSEEREGGDDRRTVVPRSAAAVAIGSVLFWLIPMTVTQPEQQNRREAEAMLRRGEVADALAFMSNLKRTDFPPVWDPPPRLGYGERHPEMPDIVAAVQMPGTADWVLALYTAKILRYAKDRFVSFARAAEYGVGAYGLERLRERESAFRLLLSVDGGLSTEEREAIEELLRVIEEEAPREDEPPGR